MALSGIPVTGGMRMVRLQNGEVTSAVCRAGASRLLEIRRDRQAFLGIGSGGNKQVSERDIL